MQKKELLSTPVVPIDIKAFDAGPILEAMGKTAFPVSYTHLTLPTIYSV